jgi:transcriptional regulator with XRE-family HTH domain
MAKRMRREPSDPNVLRRFGRRVRAVRVSRRMTQEQLADEAGLDRSYVGGVERGERNVSLGNIARIARALRVPPHKLFTGSEE